MAEVNHSYNESTTARGFTGSSWTVLPSTEGKILATDLAASTKYLIIAKAVLAGANNGDDYGVRIATGHDSNIAIRSEMRIQPTYTGTADEGKGYMFVGSFTTHASSQYTVHFEVYSWDGTTGVIDQLSLMVIDLDDLGSGNYVETWNTTSDPLGTSQWGDTLADIDYLDLSGSTEYLVLGYSQIDVLDNKSNMHIRLVADNDADGVVEQLTYASEEGEISDELRIFGFMGRSLTEATITANVEPRIQAYADATADWTKLYAYLIAIDISAFDMASTWYTFTNNGNTGLTASASVLGGFSYVRPNDGNNLVLGFVNYKESGAEGRMAQEVTYNSVSMMTGDITTTQTQAWDPTDAESAYVMLRENITDDQYIRQTAARHTSDSTLVTQYEFLAVLNLELAVAAVPPVFPRRQLATVRM